MTKWLMKTNIFAQFSLTIECLEWFRSVMWIKRIHIKSTNRFQYFAFKTITRRLDDEKAKRIFNFSEDFFFIHIVYNVIYHQTSYYHQNDSFKSQFITYDDDDSEINHIIYLICNFIRRDKKILFRNSSSQISNK